MRLRALGSRGRFCGCLVRVGDSGSVTVEAKTACPFVHVSVCPFDIVSVIGTW